MLFTTVIVFHVIVTVSLVLVVLLQSSKGTALAGSAFGGGGGGGASFGGMRSSPLSRATTVLAILFMLNCIALTVLNADTSNNAGAPDPNARSVVTEQVQKEIAAQQAAAQRAQGNDSLQAPLNIDSLVKLESGASDSF